MWHCFAVLGKAYRTNRIPSHCSLFVYTQKCSYCVVFCRRLNGLFRRIDNVADVLFWRLVVLDPWTPLLQFLGCCCFKRAGPSPTNKKSLRVVTTRNQNDPGRMLKESIDIFLCDNNNSDSSEEDDDTESDCSTTTMEQQATPTAASPTDLEFGFSGSWEEDANNWVTMIRQTSSTSSQTANRISPVSTIGSLAMKMDLISGLWEEESKKVLLLSTSSDSTTTIVSPTASSLDSPLSGSWDAESSIVSWASLQPSPTASSPTTTRSSGVGLSGVSWQDELLRVEISSGTSPAAAVTTTTFGFGMSGSWDEESNVVSSSMISQSPKASSSRTAVANVSVERKSGSWVEKAIPLVPWFGEASPPGLSGSWDEKLNIVTLQLPFDTEHQQLYTDDMNDRSSDVDPATMVETAIASLAAFDACMSGTWEEEAHIVLRWQTLDRSSRNEALESMVDVTYGSFASFVSERIEV